MKKEVKIDESRIVKMPNFEIRPSQKSLPEGKLVIFDEKDKDLCYEYYYIKAIKMFVCKTCKDKKHHVTAKVHIDDENGEKFIELSKNEHICDPIKDEFKEKTIKSSNFIVLDRNDEIKPSKIVVFTSKTKEFCYELTYVPSKNLYRCYQCKKLHATVCVKLNKNENGEEYLLKMKNEHVCIPKKYDQIQPPKTVPKPMFELYRNHRGVPNKKLIVFTSESKDFIYEYTWNKKLYCCLGCNNQNKIVTAKLCGEENEKYVELSKAEHICKPQKYDEKKFKK